MWAHQNPTTEEEKKHAHIHFFSEHNRPTDGDEVTEIGVRLAMKAGKDTAITSGT